MTKDLKQLLAWIESQVVVTETQAFNKFVATEDMKTNMQLLASLYTLESRGYIRCHINGDVKTFYVPGKEYM